MQDGPEGTDFLFSPPFSLSIPGREERNRIFFIFLAVFALGENLLPFFPLPFKIERMKGFEIIVPLYVRRFFPPFTVLWYFGSVVCFLSLFVRDATGLPPPFLFFSLWASRP